jgi:hypothetical protein
MNKIRDFLGKPAVTAVLFLLAAVLLGTGTLGGTRAALNEYSEIYESQVSMTHIGVGILENDKPVSGENAMLKDFLKDENGKTSPLVVGKKYVERLAVVNATDEDGIDQFVRVTVRKYWVDKDGNKEPALDSDWIKLGFVTGNGWTIDPNATTEERTVLYYGSVLHPGEVTTPFMDSVTIDNEIITKVTQTTTQENGLTTITTTFDYDGVQFVLVASADAIQTHNAVDAAKSAWGVNVTATEDSIALS